MRVLLLAPTALDLAGRPVKQRRIHMPGLTLHLLAALTPANVELRLVNETAEEVPYDEPWGWMQPTRHALGALLIEQGQMEEAEAVYRADLGLDATLSRACQHPGNAWSLHGLHECLTRRDETVEAAHIKLQLDKAAARAEVAIKASCYCRQKALAAE